MPCAVISIIGHPGVRAGVILGFLFVYYMTIEAVSVLPQLQFIQNAKVVFHYHLSNSIQLVEESFRIFFLLVCVQCQLGC